MYGSTRTLSSFIMLEASSSVPDLLYLKVQICSSMSFQVLWTWIITVIPFVIFPPKSDDFTDFCEGGKWQRPTKKILKNYFENFI